MGKGLLRLILFLSLDMPTEQFIGNDAIFFNSTMSVSLYSANYNQMSAL